MSAPTVTNTDDSYDRAADNEIASCLSSTTPRSFFLFAGAGSGKTHSLVEALKHTRDKRGAELRLKGQRIGVITYTKKARDEIASRDLGDDPLFAVSTIHHFAWTLIDGFNNDIREWLRVSLKDEITELELKEAKGRAGQASLDRKAAIVAKKERLSRVDGIRKFIYNPDGDNRERDSLNHAEVLKIAAAFMHSRSTFRQILVCRFPILLIDESQDTNRLLIEGLLAVQSEHKSSFVLGLIGDMMQRIYNDGKADLDKNLPDDWARPAKAMNHRCPRRIVTLINRIRQPVDGQVQRARDDKPEGVVRLFLLPGGVSDSVKTKAENEVKSRMSVITADPEWIAEGAAVQTLMLEHRMAARRLGFLPLFAPIYGCDALKTGLIRGDLSGLSFFSNYVRPVIESRDRGDEFAIAAHLRKHSPLLSPSAFEAAGQDQRQQMRIASDAVQSLVSLWSNGITPSLLDVLKRVTELGLLAVPESIRAFSKVESAPPDSNGERMPSVTSADIESDPLTAWRAALAASFDQLVRYQQYIDGRSAFDTHHGVKGREFPRVCIVMDDAEARGTTFSYEKFFGAKDGGKGSDATRRLFYVTCSRAEQSLALIVYSADPQAIKEHVLREDWFSEDEVELLTVHATE